MALLDFFRKKKESRISDEDRTQFADDMLANASLFVKQFDGVSLDFSMESIQALDQIIKENVEFYKRADNETRRKMIIKTGSYVFEVARRSFGGLAVVCISMQFGSLKDQRCVC